MKLTSAAALLLGLVAQSTAFVPHHHHAKSAISQPFLHTSNLQSSSMKPSSFSSTTTSLFMSEATSVSLDEITTQLRADKEQFDTDLAATSTPREAETLRVSYLGKKGKISQVMSFMRSLSNEDKPKLGAVVNEIKEECEEKIRSRKSELETFEIEQQMECEKLDITLPGLPGRKAALGTRHPLSMTMEKAVDIFVKLGYDTVTDIEDSPEIEEDYYCFEALNCPKDHPARDMQDTLYLTEDMGTLLRTHTSAVQIRQMEKRKPPFRIVAPGRVYRRDDIDATHSMIFHQVEILAIEERGNLNIGHLKGTVEHFLKNMFGPDIEVRFRGSYFPFTEPSMEVDVLFKGKWLEVLGCGMVDPNVLEMAGIDPNKYSGFAAGFGAERFAMVIHEISDIREFYKSDARFLDQFPHFYDEGKLSHMAGLTYKNRNAPAPAPVEEAVDGAAVAKETPKQEKKEKKKKEKKPPAPAGDIDVSKLDIRVGVITKAWEHEEADKLFCEEIDIGEESGPRQIASGLRAHYNVDDLVGQRVLVLANLKSRKLLGFPSHGMVMCAANADGSKVEFIVPPEGADVGERVMVEGFDGEPVSISSIFPTCFLLPFLII